MGETEPKSDPVEIVDAVKVPTPKGLTGRAKSDAILDVAEPLLGVDRSRGDRAWARNQEWFYFVTRDRQDTMFFPKGHPREGRPRYRWETRPDGVCLGRLVEPEVQANAGAA